MRIRITDIRDCPSLLYVPRFKSCIFYMQFSERGTLFLGGKQFSKNGLEVIYENTSCGYISYH